MLINAGSWVQGGLGSSPPPDRDPYWPGGAVVVDYADPPRLLRLLDDRTRAELGAR
jgi:hypothetical protein